MKVTLTKALLASAIAPLLLATHAAAATISWDTTAHTAASASDIVTTGTQVSAISFNSSSTYTGVGPVTLNGVTFDAAAESNVYTRFTVSTASSNPTGVVTTMSYENGGKVATLTGSDPNNAYMALFVTANYMRDVNSGANPITFSNLTAGHQYELQIWASFYGSGNNLRVSDTVPTLSGGQYNSLNQSPTLASGVPIGSDPGYSSAPQYALGTFTTGALETTQNLYWYGDQNNYGVLGAYQLRDLGAVPEPTTVALLAVGGLALILRRRFRVSGRPELA